MKWKDRYIFMVYHLRRFIERENQGNILLLINLWNYTNFLINKFNK